MGYLERRVHIAVAYILLLNLTDFDANLGVGSNHPPG